MSTCSGPDYNVSRLKFAAADFLAAQNQTAGTLSRKPFSGDRPVNPADPSGTVQSLQDPSLLIRRYQSAEIVTFVSLI